MGHIYYWKEGTEYTVTDNATTLYGVNGYSAISYYYGMKVTALKSGKITKIERNGSQNPQNIVIQNLTDNTEIWYSIANTSSPYTLTTPYSIEEGKLYGVALAGGGNYAYRNGATFPATGTAVRFEGGYYSGNTSYTYTTQVIGIWALTVKYYD